MASEQRQTDDDADADADDGPQETTGDGGTAIPVGDGLLHVPEAATPSEAAALAAALGAHMADQEAAAAQAAAAGEEADEPDWEGERFAFAGKLDRLTGHAERVPVSTPADRWTAAGRTDRF